MPGVGCRTSRSIALVGSGIALGIAAAPARADSVTIVATGTIQGGCSVGKANDFPATNNFAVGGSAQAGAAVDCNTPFQIRATSAKGAIKAAGAPSPGFVNSVPYTFGLNVALQGNTNATVACTSAAMAANACVLSSGNKTANNKTGTLTVQWNAPAPQTALVAGVYSDTITLSIVAAP